MRKTMLGLGLGLMSALGAASCTKDAADDPGAPEGGSGGSFVSARDGGVPAGPGLQGDHGSGRGGSGGAGAGGGAPGFASSGAGGANGSAGASPSGVVSELAGGDADGGADEPSLTDDAWYQTNPFVLTERDAFSTFAVDVDTASYDLFRAAIMSDFLPQPASVRLEDFVNYFHYDYPAPEADAEVPFAIALAATYGATGRDTALLRVGIQAEEPPPFDKKETNLVFLVDVSGSMREEIPAVQRLLRGALDELADEDVVSIVTYSGDTQVRLSPTPVSDRERIDAVVSGLVSAGGTRGEAGIELAYEQARAGFVEGGINHVVLCTDGDFNLGASSDEALVALIEEERESGVTLTALGFGTGYINDSMMEKVSNAGNGIYGVIATSDDAARYAQERLLATLVHVAKDVKIQVELNPERVLAYRLLGYENRAITDAQFRDDVIDAGEIGAGHRVTALYELVLEGGALPEVEAAPEPDSSAGEALPREIAASDLVLVKVRYKQPGASAQDAAAEVSATLGPAALHEDADDADDDLRYANAIAALAEALKHSPYASEARLAAALQVFDDQSDGDRDREQLAELARRAQGLLR